VDWILGALGETKAQAEQRGQLDARLQIRSPVDSGAGGDACGYIRGSLGPGGR
jgi:hypothetical protein